MDDKKEVQITFWEHALEKNVNFKVKHILLTLSAIILFGSGFLIAQIANTKWVMRSYDTGFKTALDLNPAAAYSQIGKTFCFEQGNYYTSVKKRGQAFYVERERPKEKVIILKPEIGGEK